jgi:hypothetical protein
MNVQPPIITSRGSAKGELKCGTGGQQQVIEGIYDGM